ncbi:MAG: SHOCT domain-containing protein [Solirubrobacterales bacterium]
MPGLLRGVARTAVVAGTASAVGGRVRHRQDQRWAREEAEPTALPPSPTATGPSTIEQLTQLGELKAQGILTEQEFAEQKAKLLAN